MSDSVSKFRGFYFNENLIDKRVTRVENYFFILQGKEEFKKYPFYEFIENLKAKGKNYLNELITKGELLIDREENFYIYEQEFKIFDKRYVRRGLLACFNLDSEKKVFPHEDTFEWAVEVHKNFYEISEINFEPVLLLYKGENIERYIKEEKEFFEVRDEYGEYHRIKKVYLEESFLDEIEKGDFVIADGHHRYKAIKGTKFKKRLVLLFSIFDENLKILPTHRGCNLNREKIEKLIKLSDEIDKEDVEFRIKTLRNPDIIFYHNNRFYHLRIGKKSLAVFNLHDEVIGYEKENMGFYRDYKELIKEVDRGKYNTAFFLPAIQPSDVYEHALGEIKMPPKSTDFYPKPLCGLIGMFLS